MDSGATQTPNNYNSALGLGIERLLNCLQRATIREGARLHSSIGLSKLGPSCLALPRGHMVYSTPTKLQHQDSQSQSQSLPDGMMDLKCSASLLSTRSNKQDSNLHHLTVRLHRCVRPRGSRCRLAMLNLTLPALLTMIPGALLPNPREAKTLDRTSNHRPKVGRDLTSRLLIQGHRDNFKHQVMVKAQYRRAQSVHHNGLLRLRVTNRHNRPIETRTRSLQGMSNPPSLGIVRLKRNIRAWAASTMIMALRMYPMYLRFHPEKLKSKPRCPISTTWINRRQAITGGQRRWIII